MLRCQTCFKESSDQARFCDECGTRLERAQEPVASVSAAAVSITAADGTEAVPAPAPPSADLEHSAPYDPPAVSFLEQGETVDPLPGSDAAHAVLTIERGEAVGTEFPLRAEESYIGRWDADNGIFPDVDLDPHDGDAKVSRRHARITFRGDVHMLEDLGSTNGTFLNRGRRLLPGNPQVLGEGDEIIVGKTFLRFHIIR